ncbi:MAG TPA: helix-turn-helix transcriptional regulator [Puia sp.]|nr:helix-turn-helix transcriptional regulator [Puia sp.]
MKTFFGTILLLGCLQGVVACVLLFRSKRHRQANRMLGVLILLISLATLKVYANANGWWDGHSPALVLISNFVPFFLIMPVGPLLYYYTKSCLDPRFTFGKRDRIHFFPVILDLVPVLTAFLYVGFLAVRWARPEDGPRWGAFIDAYNDYVDIPRWISVSAYLWASWRLLRHMRSDGVRSDGSRGMEAKGWLRQFLLGFTMFAGVWLLYLIPYELATDWMLDHLGWYPLYIPLVVLSYWLGIKGYLSLQTLPAPGAVLPVSVAQPVVLALERLMQVERIFLDANLNLSQLAKRAGVAPKTLSAVLNQHLGKSFNEYINEYRVREVQERLLGGGSRELTIAGLAYEAGFNSLQTFQRVFKAVSGVTPSEFMLKSGIE